MKSLAVPVFLLCAMATFAQEEPSVQARTPEAVAREEARKLQEKQRTDAALLKQRVTYGGFATDLAKSEDKLKLLSLRQPVNPAKDYKNISVDERTGRPRGFILFSIGW